MYGSQACKENDAVRQGAASTVCETALASTARDLCCTEMQCLAAERVHTYSKFNPVRNKLCCILALLNSNSAPQPVQAGCMHFWCLHPQLWDCAPYTAVLHPSSAEHTLAEQTSRLGPSIRSQTDVAFCNIAVADVAKCYLRSGSCP